MKKPQKGSLRPQDKITITAEPRANVLMVGATRETLDEVARIIEKLAFVIIDKFIADRGQE